MPKKTGMKNARMRPRSCSSICLLRIGDSPISTPAMKAPSTVWTPMKCVVSAIAPMMTRIIVMTGKSLSKLSLAQRIRKNTTRRPIVKLAIRNTAVPRSACAHAHQVDLACLGEAEGDGDDDPADRVFADRRRHDDLSEIAARETHLAHDRRDDLDRGDRQGGAEEQRGEQALSGWGSSASGMNWPSATPQANGTTTPENEMLMAARPTFRTSLRSVSIPVSSSSRRMPNCETPSIIAFSARACAETARAAGRAGKNPTPMARAECRPAACP